MEEKQCEGMRLRQALREGRMVAVRGNERERWTETKWEKERILGEYLVSREEEC